MISQDSYGELSRRPSGTNPVRLERDPSSLRWCRLVDERDTGPASLAFSEQARGTSNADNTYPLSSSAATTTKTMLVMPRTAAMKYREHSLYMPDTAF